MNKLWVFILSCLSLSVMGQESRVSLESSSKLKGDWDFDYKGEYRWDRYKSNDNHYVYASTKLNYKFSKKFKMGLGARYGIGVASLPVIQDHEEYRYRVTLDGRYNTKSALSAWSRAIRLRYQLNNKGLEENEHLARLRLAYKNYYSNDLHLYVSFENFYNFAMSGNEKSRFSIGSVIKMKKQEINLFYISDIRFLKRDLNTEHALGVSFSI